MLFPALAGLCARLSGPVGKLTATFGSCSVSGPPIATGVGSLAGIIHTCCRAVPGRRQARATLKGDLLPCLPVRHKQRAQQNEEERVGLEMGRWLHAEDLLPVKKEWQASTDGRCSGRGRKPEGCQDHCHAGHTPRRPWQCWHPGFGRSPASEPSSPPAAWPRPP